MLQIIGTMPDAENIINSYNQYRENGETVGSNTGMYAEASDASVSGATVEDGMSGDTDFPYCQMKTILSRGAVFFAASSSLSLCRWCRPLRLRLQWWWQRRHLPMIYSQLTVNYPTHMQVIIEL